MNAKRTVATFLSYMEAEHRKVTRSAFENNLMIKVSSRQFNEDLRPLLGPGVRYDAAEAASLVAEKLLSLL